MTCYSSFWISSSLKASLCLRVSIKLPTFLKWTKAKTSLKCKILTSEAPSYRVQCFRAMTLMPLCFPWYHSLHFHKVYSSSNKDRIIIHLLFPVKPKATWINNNRKCNNITTQISIIKQVLDLYLFHPQIFFNPKFVNQTQHRNLCKQWKNEK